MTNPSHPGSYRELVRVLGVNKGEIPAVIGRRAMPNGPLLFPFHNIPAIGEEISRVLPMFQGIEELRNEGDYRQWGGARLFKGGNFRGMASARARSFPLDLSG